MIPRSIAAVLASTASVAALAAVSVHFDVSCLPREAQEDARAKATAIMDAAAAKRRTLAGVTGPDSFTKAMTERDAKQLTLNECGIAAKKAGKAPLEACAREFTELREAVNRVDRIYDLTINPERPVDAEEQRQLETLRAQYPACAGKKT